MSNSLRSMGSSEKGLNIVKEETEEKVVEAMYLKIGPVGSDNYDQSSLCPNGESYYGEWDGKGHYKIEQIFISSQNDFRDFRITSFQYQYIEDGISKLSPAYGREIRGPNFEVVTQGEEYITRITGTHDRCPSHSKIMSLSFETNSQKYGPFGVVRLHDPKFKLDIGQRNRFGGLFGGFSSRGDYLSYLGAYIMPNVPSCGDHL